MFWMAGFYVNSLFCPFGFSMYLSATPSFCHTSYYLVLIDTPPSQRSPSDDCFRIWLPDSCSISSFISQEMCLFCVIFSSIPVVWSNRFSHKQPGSSFFIILETVFANKTVWLATSSSRLLVFFVKVCSFVYGNTYKHILLSLSSAFHGPNLYTIVSCIGVETLQTLFLCRLVASSQHSCLIACCDYDLAGIELPSSRSVQASVWHKLCYLNGRENTRKIFWLKWNW